MSHVGSAQDTEDELRNAFHVFDKDGSGTISASEMREVLKTLGEDLSEKEINEIMSAADTDGDKSIDCELFFFLFLFFTRQLLRFWTCYGISHLVMFHAADNWFIVEEFKKIMQDPKLS